jgi:hypothetical protein
MPASRLQSFGRAAFLAAMSTLGVAMTQCVSEYDILGARGGAAGANSGGGGNASIGGGSGGANTGGTDTGGTDTGGTNSTGGATGGTSTGGTTGGASSTGGVLDSGGGSSGASGGGPPGGPPGGRPPWTPSTCDRALSQGLDRDPCIGDFSCESALRDCCKWVARCSLGQLSVVPVCNGCACRNDDDCPPSSWCVDAKCVACPPPVPCQKPVLYPLPRKECFWCITASKCHSVMDCAPPQVCYPGQPCPPGFEGDPAFCHGSICGDVGCGPTTGLDCSVVGCPDGYWCDMIDGPATCACVNGLWLCTPGSRNTCRLF